MYLSRNIALSGFLTFIALTPAAATADIYKWVDDKGNIHYGDMPKDKRVAENAEKMDIREAYTPNETLSTEEAAMRAKEAAARNRLDGRREKERQRRELEKAQGKDRASVRAEMCARYHAEYQQLTEIQMIDDRPTYHYLVDENGEPVSVTYQEEYTEDLRRRGVDANCPQFAKE